MEFSHLIGAILVLILLFSVGVFAKDIIIEKTKPLFKAWFGQSDADIDQRALTSAKEYFSNYMQGLQVCYAQNPYGDVCKCSSLQSGMLQNFKMLFVKTDLGTDAYLMPPDFTFNTFDFANPAASKPQDHFFLPMAFVPAIENYKKGPENVVEPQVPYSSLFEGSDKGIKISREYEGTSTLSPVDHYDKCNDLLIVRGAMTDDPGYVSNVNPGNGDGYNIKISEMPFCDDLAGQALQAQQAFDAFTSYLDSCRTINSHGRSCRCDDFPAMELNDFQIFTISGITSGSTNISLQTPTFLPERDTIVDILGFRTVYEMVKYRLDAFLAAALNSFDKDTGIGPTTNSNYNLIKTDVVDVVRDIVNIIRRHGYPEGGKIHWSDDNPTEFLRVVHLIDASGAVSLAFEYPDETRVPKCSDIQAEYDSSKAQFDYFVSSIESSAVSNQETDVTGMPAEASIILSYDDADVIRIQGMNFPYQEEMERLDSTAFVRDLSPQKLRVVVDKRITEPQCAGYIRSPGFRTPPVTCYPSVDDCQLCVYSQEYSSTYTTCTFDKATLTFGSTSHLVVDFKDKDMGDACSAIDTIAFTGRTVAFLYDEGMGDDTSQYVTLMVR